MVIMEFLFKIVWILAELLNITLDREEQDFSLEVASAGVSPLKIATIQKKYWKNIKS
jgi:hypothetical protein